MRKLKALVKCGIDSRYNNSMNNLYNNTQFYLKEITTFTEKVPTRKGFRQSGII